MKKLFAVAAAVLAVVFLGFFGIAHAQGPSITSVHRMVFVGEGFGIPQDWDFDDLKWVNKVAVGSVRKGNETRRVGVLSITDSDGDHRYKIRNIVADNGSVTGDIFQNDTKIGNIAVTFRDISGREAWAGTMTLNNWQGQVIIKGHKIRFKSAEGPRILAGERSGGRCAGLSDKECMARYYARTANEDVRSREELQKFCEEDRSTCRRLVDEHPFLKMHSKRFMKSSAAE